MDGNFNKEVSRLVTENVVSRVFYIHSKSKQWFELNIQGLKYFSTSGLVWICQFYQYPHYARMQGNVQAEICSTFPIKVFVYCCPNGRLLESHDVNGSCGPPYGRWWSLPQYLTNLTQPTGIKKATFFCDIRPCTNNMVYARFKVFLTFLSVFRVFLG